MDCCLRSKTQTYTYDLARRVKSITYDYTASGLSALQSIELTYSPDGLLSLLTWKSNEVTFGAWEYRYDGAGRITSVKNLHGDEVRFEYDASGKLVSEQHSNGVTTSYTFDEVREWITRIIHQTPAETLSLEMTRDKTGKVVSILSGEKSTHFAYDELYRLVREVEGDTTTSFEYDLSGNLVKKDGSDFGTYDGVNKLLTFADDVVTHDTDGNITTAGGETFFWNSQGKLLERTKDGVPTFYRYSDNGYRVVREREGQKTFFIYLGNLLLGEVSEDESIKRSYTWGPSGISSLREENGSFTLLSGSRGEALSLKVPATMLPLLSNLSSASSKYLPRSSGPALYGAISSSMTRSADISLVMLANKIELLEAVFHFRCSSSSQLLLIQIRGCYSPSLKIVIVLTPKYGQTGLVKFRISPESKL